jgi:hypothetical protein
MLTNWLKRAGFLVVAFSLLLSPLSVAPAFALSVPTLISPSDFSTTTAADTPPLGIPEFKWAAVSGATKYRLQVSSDIAFTTTVVDTTTPNTAYTPTNASQFTDVTWYWRVRVEEPAPVGAYSGIWRFTRQWAAPANAPVLISPADFATVEFYDYPLFSWNPVTGAARYRIQIYASPGGWATPFYNETTLTTSFQPNLKLTNGTYYWRVVPIDPGNRDGTPSVERSFTTGYSPVLTLLEPTPNVVTYPTFTPTFRWTAVRGAQYYLLQYSTDPTFASNITQVDTRNTSYTPISALPNDQNYYWRVRVHSGNSISGWTTASQYFRKQWYIKPTLLTPVDSYQHVRFPLYSWTPVPGANYYKVEISLFPGFSPIFDEGITSNTFYSPSKYEGGLSTYYWRVTPYDGNSNKGKESNTSSYVSYYYSVAPHLVSPLFYYPPDTYSGFPGVTTNPHEDRTVALPIFIWHRVSKPYADPDAGNVYALAYRLQVSIDPTFDTVDWTVDTENTTAAPTTSNPFTPAADTDYYWRVRPLTGIGGSEIGQWSQRWKTRFDADLGLTPSGGVSPSLIRPTNGFEFAETTPLLEWFPMTGASSYDVEISQDQNFGSTVNTATVFNPVYIPTQSFAQRSLGDQNFGIYYWRVRKTGSGSWSEIRRFQISAQSQWKYTRTLADVANRLQIGSDPDDIADNDYELTSLQAAQSSGYWHFGFHVPTAPTKNVTYALYLDLDHQDISGATSDARGYSATTISAYRPEYAIYVLQQAGAYAANKVYLYHWSGSGWETVNQLSEMGGAINYNSGYVELQLPNTAIGYQDTTGSYAVSLLSLPASSGAPQDSVPSDPNVPGAGAISRFSNVTERMNLVMQPNTVGGVDPSANPSILPFFWDWSVLAPWSGAYMRAYLDPQFTTMTADYWLESSAAYYGMTSHSWSTDFAGDNTYYWRIQPRYRDSLCVLCLGAWSQGWSFERQGFIPGNLKTSVSFATPTFSWNMVEGAESYDLQVDNDVNFGSLEINANTRQNSYTDTHTLANGVYYWRVRVRRYNNVVNNWTPNQTFTLTLPSPSGLNHTPSGVVGHAPSMCWTPLIVNSPTTGDPILAAWRYRFQISAEPSFTNPIETMDTEQSCWTPRNGYADGQYYWRVAMMDGEGKLGNYSAYQTFTKQYPITTLVSPTNGASTNTTPTFVWTPVIGAASYRIEVSQFDTFSPTYEVVETNNAHWTPQFTYTTDKTYYWRVAIRDMDGKLGPFVGATIILGTTPTNPVYLPFIKR